MQQVVKQNSSVKTREQLIEQEFDFDSNIFNTRFTNFQYVDVKMAIIGKTGTGKTSLINTLVNIFEGKCYEEPRTIAISQVVKLNNPKTKDTSILEMKCNMTEFASKQSDVKGGKQSESQTQCANIYQFNTPNYNLSLIDSPGIGDTRGIEQDKKHILSVVQAVKALGQFNAICLVYKADETRVDPNIKYLISQYQNIMTKGCQDNIMICFTHVSNPYFIPAADSLKEADLLTGKTPTFYFDNSSLIPFSAYINIPQRDQEAIKKMEKDKWERNYSNAQDMILTLSKMNYVEGQEIVDLYLKRQLAYNLSNKEIQSIKVIQDKEAQCQKRKEWIQNAIREMDRYKNFNITTSVPEKIKKKMSVQKKVHVNIAPKKATICINHDDKPCHFDCQLERISTQGDVGFRMCWAFSDRGDNCGQCNCHYKYHLHDDKILKTETVEEEYDEIIHVQKQVKDGEMEQLYLKFEREKLQYEKELYAVEAELSKLRKEKEDCFQLISVLKLQITQKSLKNTNNNLIDYFQHQIEQKIDEHKNGLLKIQERDSFISMYKTEIACYDRIEKLNVVNPPKQFQIQVDMLLKQERILFDSAVAKQANLQMISSSHDRSSFSYSVRPPTRNNK